MKRLLRSEELPDTEDVMVIVQIALLASIVAGPLQQTQPPKPSPSAPAQKPDPAAKVTAADLGVDLDRIQRALARTPRLQFDDKLQPVFRVQIFGDKPTIEDILGPEFWKGPVPHGGMTHQEFLTLVTPKDVQGYAAFSNEEGARVAATSFLFQWALQRAVQKYNETQDATAREAARREVEQALKELEQARAKAGAVKR
jgi:hypothetical protein